MIYFFGDCCESAQELHGVETTGKPKFSKKELEAMVETLEKVFHLANDKINGNPTD